MFLSLGNTYSRSSVRVAFCGNAGEWDSRLVLGREYVNRGMLGADSSLLLDCPLSSSIPFGASMASGCWP